MHEKHFVSCCPCDKCVAVSTHGPPSQAGRAANFLAREPSLFQPKTATLEDIAIAPMKGIHMLAGKYCEISEVQCCGSFFWKRDILSVSIPDC